VPTDSVQSCRMPHASERYNRPSEASPQHFKRGFSHGLLTIPSEAASNRIRVTSSPPIGKERETGEEKGGGWVNREKAKRETTKSEGGKRWGLVESFKDCGQA
jgi:hypothetical protein